MTKRRSGLPSRTTPHTSPHLRANYGVSFVSYTGQASYQVSIWSALGVPDRVIMELHKCFCVMQEADNS